MILARIHLLTAAATLISIVHGFPAGPIPVRAQDNPLAPLRGLPTVLGDSPDDLSGQTKTNRPAMQVSTFSQTIHGGLQIPALIVVAEASRFSFLPPPGWRAQSSVAEKRIRLVHPETGALITIDITEEKTNDVASVSSEAFRERALARHPNGKILDEFQVSALGRSGPGLDLEWRTENNLRQLTRFALVPCPGGCLEFSLTGGGTLGRSQQHDFNRLLLSFRAAPLTGKLEIQPVTPE